MNPACWKTKNQGKVKDPGDWAWGYLVARRLTDNIELEYQFSKKQVHDQKSFISDVMRVDNAVIKVVKSFQSKQQDWGQVYLRSINSQ